MLAFSDSTDRTVQNVEPNKGAVARSLLFWSNGPRCVYFCYSVGSNRNIFQRVNVEQKTVKQSDILRIAGSSLNPYS